MTIDVLIPGLSLRSNPWAEISERLRRIHQFHSAYSSISIGVFINFNRRIHQFQSAYSSISIGVFIQFQTDALLTGDICGRVTGGATAAEVVIHDALENSIEADLGTEANKLADFRDIRHAARHVLESFLVRLVVRHKHDRGI